MELRDALTQITEIRLQMARTEVFRGYRAVPAAFSGAVALAAATVQAVAIGPWGFPSAWGNCSRLPCCTTPWRGIMTSPKTTPEDSTGRFAYEGLERIFHEKARLGIMTSLVTNPRGVIFSDLKDLCHLTDGNLSRHLQVLNEAGFVEIWKGFHKNRPQTLCRITEEGRRRFLEYINVLETVVQDALKAAPIAPAGANLTEGWSPV